MIDILYEDHDVIVVHKPAGLAVQTRSVAEPDAESLLKKHLKESGSGSYLGIVHRLDQPVEGILVFAKNEKAAAALSEQIRDKGEERKTSGKNKEDPGAVKEYLALVFGKMPAEKGTLIDLLMKDARTNTSRVTNDPGVGKRSVLDYEVIRTGEHLQLLRIRLKTGRHHQIRVQLSHAGCPILGDMKYKSAASEEYAKVHAIRGLQLYADHLVFYHPVSRKKMEFSIEPDLPEEGS